MKEDVIFSQDFLYLSTDTTEVSVLDTTKTKHCSFKSIDNFEKGTSSEILQTVSILTI